MQEHKENYIRRITIKFQMHPLEDLIEEEIPSHAVLCGAKQLRYCFSCLVTNVFQKPVLRPRMSTQNENTKYSERLT